MRKETTDPRKIILWSHMGAKRELWSLVQNKEWFDEHPIAVFEAPEELSYLGKYMIYDGHNRAAASMMFAMESVPILILETTEDISKIFGEQSRPYKIVKRNVTETIKDISKRDTYRARLDNARTRGYEEVAQSA